MTSYVTPKKNAAYITYIGLPQQSNPAIFKDTPTLAAGDFKVSIDGGALANLTNLPTNTPGNQMVKLSLTAAEMNGDNITIVCHDAAGAEWGDVILNIQTSANQIDDIYSKVSGLTFTVANQVDVNVVDWKGATAPAMTGDAFARLGAPAGASVSADIAAAKAVVDAIKTKTDSLTFTVAGMVDANVVDWKGATAPAMTGDAYARLGAPAGASIAADIAAIKVDTANIYSKVDTEIASIISTLGTPAGVSLAADVAAVKGDTGAAVTQTTAAAIRADVGLASANLDTQLSTIASYIDTEIGTILTNIATIPTAIQNADALLDRAAAIEGYTPRQLFRLVGSILLGKVSGAGTGTEVFRDLADTKDRVTATVDANGNRSAITRDAT